MILLRRVQDERGRGFQAFIEGHLVVGDALFEAEFYPTETYVAADRGEYEGSAYTREPNRHRVYEPVGPLKWIGVHDSDSFWRHDIITARAGNCKQTVLKEKPAPVKSKG